MTCYFSVKTLGHFFLHTVKFACLYVCDVVTLGAYKMTMRFCITVESVRSVPCCDLGDLTQVNQQRQVSVYRRQVIRPEIREAQIRTTDPDPPILRHKTRAEKIQIHHPINRSRRTAAGCVQRDRMQQGG